MMTVIRYSFPSGVTQSATPNTRNARRAPAAAVRTGMVLPGIIAPIPTTVKKYFTKSNKRLASFSRLLWYRVATDSKYRREA